MPSKIEAHMELTGYTTPAPTLLDPQGIMTVEEARKVVGVYNALMMDYYRALLHREQCINSMAAAIAPAVLAHVQRDVAAVYTALEAYVQQHVNVYGPGVASSAAH